MLKHILCGHFDEQNWEYGGGGKVSHQRWRVTGGCHLRKLKVIILKTIMDCMVLKLTVYIRNVIFFSVKPETLCQILKFGTF